MVTAIVKRHCCCGTCEINAVEVTLWVFWLFVLLGTAAGLLLYLDDKHEIANILNLVCACVFGVAWIIRKGYLFSIMWTEEHKLDLCNIITSCCKSYCCYESQNTLLLEALGTTSIAVQLLAASLLLAVWHEPTPEDHVRVVTIVIYEVLTVKTLALYGYLYYHDHKEYKNEKGEQISDKKRPTDAEYRMVAC